MSGTKSSDPIGKPSDRRKLIAVTYMDMVGYSRLIGLDDAGTLNRLRALRRGVIDPAIEEHGGGVVQTGGDSLLIVFDSIDGAVRCAVRVQQQIPTHDGDQPPDQVIRFRIGINIGDAIADGTDLHGDAVNVVARLQAECPPGGICVTRGVRDHVRDRLDLAFDDLGALDLKNISRPVEAFLLRAVGTSAGSIQLPSPDSRSHNLPQPGKPSIAVTDVQDRRLNSLPAVAIALPDKPSIAVLAFTNMSGPEQEHLSDGVADDIITELSRYPSLFVIARNSSFAYKGRSVDVRQIRRELDVRYVLEGSLRRAGGQLRITAQLVDAGTGRHVWAERYDRHLTDILAILDEITNEVVIAIAPAISVAEQQRAMRRTTGTLDAWAAYQRGMWHLNRVTAEDNTLAHNFFQQAIDLDPNFSGGYKGLCATLSYAPDYWGNRLADKLDLAETMARQAIALDSNDAEARVQLAIALRRRGDCKGSLAEVEHALALCPNLAGAHAARGAVLIYSGRPEEGVPELEKSIRLDPHRTAVRLNQIAMGLYHNGDYRASVEASNRAIRSYPLFPNSYRWLAAALGQLGEIPGARKALEKATDIASAAFEMYVRKRPPFVREEDFQHMLKGLRNAGWTPTQSDT